MVKLIAKRATRRDWFGYNDSVPPPNRTRVGNISSDSHGPPMNVTVRRLATKGLLPAGAAIAISWSIFYANVLGTTVTASWTYDYEPQPACSSAQATNCIDHFEVKDITDQRDMTLIKKVSNPEHPVGKVDHISTVFKYGPPFGPRTLSVIAVARDPRGNRVTSNPFAARATVTIRPGAQMSLLF